MKTETRIADENVISATTGRAKFWHKSIAEEHLASCQRFLEFLRGFRFFKGERGAVEYLQEKDKDLQNAIKIYGDAGIK